MQKSAGVLVAVMVLAAGSFAYAGPEEEARTLKDEANTVLQKGSGVTLDPKEYAQCVIKLEKALDILDKAGKTESDLAVEVNTALYWARKFTTANIINEIQKAKGSTDGGMKTGDTSPKHVDPPKNVDPPKSGDDLSMVKQKKMFEDAQQYANQHASDDYAVSLRWFKAADELAGTEYSVKALAFAREAQERFAKKQGTFKDEKLDDTPAMALVKEGDGFYTKGKLDEAILSYQNSLKKDQTLVATRRIARAHFDNGQKMKDVLLPKFEALDQEYRKAYDAATETRRTAGGQTFKKVNWRDPALMAATAKLKELQAEAKDALEQYNKAANYYRSVLNMVPEKKDLDAAGHLGLCYSVRRADMYARNDAKRMLAQFLDDYKPANDIERALYEFCRSELVQLNKPIPKTQ
ncbi:MAG: hypothetical protein HY291_17860 [Planctomycetes bacterium]|nr:hypothetical protein [Planctomycetota bacterium]